MWYLLACGEQEEQKIAAFCKDYLSGRALWDAFVLTYDRVRRYEGSWHPERKLLYPGCVFLDSGNEEVLSAELWEYGLVDGRGNCLIRMSREEEEFLKDLCGREYHLGMSRGIIFKGETRVTDGPLKGREKRIRRIDRHKRLAQVETAAAGKDSHCFAGIGTGEAGMAGKYGGSFGKFRYIPAGLEITEKVV